MSNLDVETKPFPQEEEEAGVVDVPIADIHNMTTNQIAEAYRATIREHKMGVLQAIRLYKKALGWSAIFGLCLIMQAYDTDLHSSFYALPEFQKRFGNPVKGKKGQYQLTPEWQSSISDAGTSGIIIGILSNAWLTDRFGYKKMVMIDMALITCLIFVNFFAQSLPMLLVGQFLLDIPLGNVNTIAPAYAVEVAPLGLRHYGPTFTHLCVVVGHLISSGLLNIFVDFTTDWAWRIPYAVQWIWPVPIFCALAFAPESPWWLVRHNRVEEAQRSLKRLVSKEVDTEESLSLIQHTVELERAMSFGASIWDCFKGVDRRRTEIAFNCFVAQILCGFAIPSGVYFFEVAGLPTKEAFKLQVGQYALGTVSTLISFWMMQHVGRRAMLFIGSFGQAAALGIIGILSLLPNQTLNIVWPQGIMVLVRFFFFGLSLGPLAYVTGSEISSVRLRQKTLALGIAAFFVITLVSNIVSPFLLNPTAANLKGKAAWIATGLNLLIAVWGYFRLPETKGRSIEEIDIMFAKKVPARKFKYYVVNTEEEFGVTVEKTMVEEVEAVPKGVV